MVDVKRSLFGTIFICILILIHLQNAWAALSLFIYDYADATWLEISAELTQLIIFILYIVMLFVPLRTPWVRYLLAALIFLTFFWNIGVFFVVLNQKVSWWMVWDLWLVLCDLPVAIVLCFPFTSRVNKLLPFYAEEPSF